MDERAVLSCRVYRDYWVETPEVLINLEESDGDAGQVLVLVEPRRRSIWMQLRRAHRHQPDLDLDEILPAAMLRSTRCAVTECADLASLERLDAEGVEAAPQPDSITIHPLVRQCLSSRGEIIIITEDLHLAARWLDRAHRAIISCGSTACTSFAPELRGQHLSWRHIIQTVDSFTDETSYCEIVARLGEPYARHPTITGPDEYILYYAVPGEPEHMSG